MSHALAALALLNTFFCRGSWSGGWSRLKFIVSKSKSLERINVNHIEDRKGGFYLFVFSYTLLDPDASSAVVLSD